ncbi:hypothetical protein GCM10007301_54240 [Azorhizobium oxalatiphilum]|uniref:Sulfotransferase family protein n=1 Tax=Azorhizobium oxalatiphilum TaxID=980631 RepID=A0A917FJD3_9HYPH|nr:hypothetical protein [Azorhizobium oxalatiphilum]GGF87501.1 hypothetical protein GCM10007301_54240 [Azorhizobium oxalatiphilum]
MIYICYGVTKSASTYLYQLTEEILCLSGMGIGRIRRRSSRKLENYYDYVTAPLLERVQRVARGRPVVLKTHGALLPEVAQMIAAGEVLASASIRDPREMALSMADNGRRARDLGILPFAEVHTPVDALPSIDMQMAFFEQWSAIPQVELFTYNEICFDSEAAITRVARHLGVTVDAARVLAPFRDGALIGQFNVGRPQRYREMDPATQALFLGRYAALYARFDFETAAPSTPARPLPPRGALGHRMESTRRFLRRFFQARSLGIVEPD